MRIRRLGESHESLLSSGRWIGYGRSSDRQLPSFVAACESKAMQHLAVLALIVGNMASVGAIVMSVGIWRQLRLEFLRHFIAFQALVFFAGLCELTRSYLDANLGTDGIAPSVSFTVAVSVATLLGLASLIRSVEAVLSRNLGWLFASFLAVAIPLAVASTLHEARTRVVLASAEVVSVLQVLLVTTLLTLASLMLTTPSAASTRRRVLAVRLAGAWLAGKVLFDSCVAAVLSLRMIDTSGALALQGVGEAIAASVVIFHLRRFTVAMATDDRAAAKHAGLNTTLLSEHTISPREAEIILQVVGGRSNKEIAQQLHISPATVKDHLYNVFQKTGVKNRVQLANLFRHSG